MSDDPTDEKCFGCDALMPSFLECCPSCGWERVPELSREARLRAMGGGNVPAYVKVLFVVCPIISVVFAGITVAVWPKQSDLDVVVLKRPPPIPTRVGFEGRLAHRRRRALEEQWFAYNAQQERLEKKRAEQERLRQAKIENGNTTK